MRSGFVTILGRPPAGLAIDTVLFPEDAGARASMRLLVSDAQTARDALQREMFLSLIPSEVRLGQRTLALEYVPLGALDGGLMAVISDVTTERSLAEQEALGEYGHNLGIGFQLVDDALDYSAQQAQLGKTVGDDFREGKITLPVLHAYHAGDEAERAFWRRTVGELEQGEDDLAQAMRLMETPEVKAARAKVEYRWRAAVRNDPTPEAWALFDERLSPVALVGMAVCVAGVALVNWRSATG